MKHAYLTESLIKEALEAKAITEQEAKELATLLTIKQPELLEAC